MGEADLSQKIVLAKTKEVLPERIRHTAWERQSRATVSTILNGKNFVREDIQSKNE